MRRFYGGYDIVNVWSVTMAEHQAALEIYEKNGYENASAAGPQLVASSPVPFRSVVQRKLRHTRDESR